MSGLVLRLVVLGVVVGAAWLIVDVVERRRGRRRGTPAGSLVLITGEGCRLCGPAEQALRAQGVEPRVVDVGEPHGLGRPRSLPVAVVTGDHGAVVMRRSGRSVIDDASRLAAVLSAVRE